MSRQRGFIHHFPLLSLVIFGLVIAGAYLYFQGNLPLSFLQKSPKVEPKITYENPFKKETQFVNPFDSYKNPFVVNR